MAGDLLLWFNIDDSNSDSDYIAVMDEADFTLANIESIKNDRLTGILVLNSTSEKVYSPEPQTPQGQYTPSSDLTIGNAYAWNVDGDGRDEPLTMANLYGIPTAFIRSVSVSSYILGIATDQAKTVQEKGDLSPAILAEYNYYMGPEDMDSPSCLDWNNTDGTWAPKCLPLGASSVWATATASLKEKRRRLEDDEGSKGVVMLATSIDDTSMFHDAAPGSNTAASNILTLLLAAQLIGKVPTDTRKGLAKEISFGFFQGESYGFIGSRAFFGDVVNFVCDEDRTVPAVAKKNGENDEKACLHPLRPSLAFQDLGEIAGLIAVDQVGILATEGTLYVHGSQDDDDFGGFLSNVLLASGTDNIAIQASSVEAEDGEAPLPPTPLTSLIKKTGGAVGGVVLAGFDDAFVSGYHTHVARAVDLDSISGAAVVLARAAIAAAYDGGDFDADTASEYANALIEDSVDTDLLTDLHHCLFEDGSCELFRSYDKVELANEKERTGLDLSTMFYRSPLGTPPNYYVSVLDASRGQPLVLVGSLLYGSYTKDEYGKKDSDAFVLLPTTLASSIKGLLNSFLGTLDDSVSCKSSKDCSKIDDCNAVCTGANVCVCDQAHYHLAMDEALQAASDKGPGFFVVSDEDEGISAMYTEPYWSSSVGVRVYRVLDNKSGLVALGFGVFVAVLCVVSTTFIKRRFESEKLF